MICTEGLTKWRVGHQVSVLEQLADLLEASGVPRNEDEDLPAMREEARRKLEEINEVGTAPEC